VTEKKGKKPKILIDNPQDGFIPYLTIEAFEKGIISQYADIESSVIADENDIFIVWDGARSGLAAKGKNGAVCSTVRKIRPIDIETEYLFRFIQSNYTLINTNPKGSGTPHVHPDIFWNINIPIPSKRTQQKIVEKLDKLLPKIRECRERLEKIPAIIKRYKQAVLNAAVTGKLTEDWRGKKSTYEPKDNNFDLFELFEIPTEWTWKYLYDTCSEFKYGSSIKSLKKGKVPVLRMGNIQDGKMDLTDLVFSNDKNEIEKYKLEFNDVLFNRTNSPELVGKTAIFKETVNAIYAGYLIRMKTNEELESDYLNAWMNTSYSQRWKLLVKTDGVSQSNINAKKLSEFIIPIPTIDEQQEIAKRIDTLFKKADAIMQRYKKAKALVDKMDQSVLAKAFRGELVS